jgi:hypothetical protein
MTQFHVSGYADSVHPTYEGEFDSVSAVCAVNDLCAQNAGAAAKVSFWAVRNTRTNRTVLFLSAPPPAQAPQLSAPGGRTIG